MFYVHLTKYVRYNADGNKKYSNMLSLGGGNVFLKIKE